jgi:hypothetical protein
MLTRRFFPLDFVTTDLNAYDYVTYAVGVLDIIVFITAAVQLYRFSREERQVTN